MASESERHYENRTKKQRISPVQSGPDDEVSASSAPAPLAPSSPPLNFSTEIDDIPADEPFLRSSGADERAWRAIPYLYDFFYEFGMDWPFGSMAWGPITVPNFTQQSGRANKSNDSEANKGERANYCMQRLYYSQNTDAAYDPAANKYTGFANLLTVAEMPLPTSIRAVNMAKPATGKPRKH
jgi:hypothetical protein